MNKQAVQLLKLPRCDKTFDIFNPGIPVLFTRSDSVYKKIPNLDVFDFERNALSCQNQLAGIYHPPCRAWGQLKHLAKPRPGEKKLAIWSLFRINKYGGALEHPYNSELFKHYKFLMDGGIVVNIEQVWFGHKARKPTKLYIKGLDHHELPIYKILATKPTHQVSNFKFGANYKKKNNKLPELNKSDRERTPPLFANWLVEICKLIEAKKLNNNNELQYIGQKGLFH